MFQFDDDGNLLTEATDLKISLSLQHILVFQELLETEGLSQKKKNNPPSLFTCSEGIKIIHLRHQAVTHAEDCWQLRFEAPVAAPKCFLMQDLVISDLNKPVARLKMLFFLFSFAKFTSNRSLCSPVSFTFPRQICCLTLWSFLCTDHHPALVYVIPLLNH